MLGLKPNRITETCGWYGMGALIVAYGLASFGIIRGNSLEYLILNLSGGLGLMVIAAAKDVAQSVILNIFWAIIGVVAIIKAII